MDLREPRALIDSFGEGGAEIVAVVNSDDLPPPQGDLLCELTMRVRRDPHRIFLTEVDRMLSAGGDALVESGPRFMANIKIRPDR